VAMRFDQIFLLFLLLPELEFFSSSTKVARQKWMAKWKPSEFPEPESGDLERSRRFIRLKYVDQRWREGPPESPSHVKTSGRHDDVCVLSSFSLSTSLFFFFLSCQSDELEIWNCFDDSQKKQP
jgi:hypothetical protein